VASLTFHLWSLAFLFCELTSLLSSIQHLSIWYLTACNTFSPFCMLLASSLYNFLPQA